MWFATVVAGLMVRPELRGVTSIIRALNLRPKCPSENFLIPENHL